MWPDPEENIPLGCVSKAQLQRSAKLSVLKRPSRHSWIQSKGCLERCVSFYLCQ